jgi:very-short-patch-repair endonuclease
VAHQGAERMELRHDSNRARSLRSSQTDTENLLWTHLPARRLSGFKFRRQVPVNGYIVDFVCIEVGLVVEVDGGQHADQIASD